MDTLEKSNLPAGRRQAGFLSVYQFAYYNHLRRHSILGRRIPAGVYGLADQAGEKSF
jgi:hypothetical protein